MKDFMKKFLVEDWVVTFLSIPLLIIAGCATFLPTQHAVAHRSLTTTREKLFRKINI